MNKATLEQMKNLFFETPSENLLAVVSSYCSEIGLTAADAQNFVDIMQTLRNSTINVQNIPNWATWTPEQFQAWCDANLMTNTEIDEMSLNAALKKNLKANNAFTRNAGKMLIAVRNYTWPKLSD